MSDIGSGISAGPREPEDDTPIAAQAPQSQSNEENTSANVSSLRDGVLKQGQRSADVLGQHAKAQPISSLLIAFAGGFILGQLISRR
jgi:ElaB/YqjD/DUF883 family membrane-anchored ribosome-binding protein